MTTMPVSKFRSTLSETANKVAFAGDRICVQRNRKPLFAVVSIDDMRLLEHLEDKMDLDLVKEAIERDDFASWDKVKKELGL